MEEFWCSGRVSPTQRAGGSAVSSLCYCSDSVHPGQSQLWGRPALWRGRSALSLNPDYNSVLFEYILNFITEKLVSEASAAALCLEYVLCLFYTNIFPVWRFSSDNTHIFKTFIQFYIWRCKITLLDNQIKRGCYCGQIKHTTKQ